MGEEHQDEFWAMGVLARTLGFLGRYVEAEKLASQSLEGMRRLLGDEHPASIMALTSLDVIVSLSGRYGEAERLQREANELSVRVLGAGHPDALFAAENLRSAVEMNAADQGAGLRAGSKDAGVTSSSDSEPATSFTSPMSLALPLLTLPYVAYGNDKRRKCLIDRALSPFRSYSQKAAPA